MNLHYSIFIALSTIFCSFIEGARRLTSQPGCHTKRSDDREESTFAPWTYARVFCNNVDYGTVVICDKECRDPRTGLVLSQYKPESILHTVYLVSNGNVRKYDIPVACKCVPAEKRQEKVPKRAKKLTGLHRLGMAMRKYLQFKRNQRKRLG